MITYPEIDPVLLSIGPFEIRWYGISYMLGLLTAFTFLKPILQKKLNLSVDDILNLATAYVIGIVLGGRLGYVLFYDLAFYLENPVHIFSIWKGGMSYHGGGIGAIIAMCVYAKKERVSVIALLDLLGIGTCFGVFFGRIANFINGELYGRVTDVPWAMVFPGGGPLPRHPSQLYESFLEGFLLFWILYFAMKKLPLKPGQLFSLYLGLYGFFRFSVEFTREPDAHLGFILGNLTMGQILSGVMIMMGVGTFLFFKMFADRSGTTTS